MQKTATLKAIVQPFEQHIQLASLLDTAVSAQPIGWHIEHSLLTISLISERLKITEPSKYAPRFSILKTLVMTFGKIPRGKAKAPSVVQPANWSIQHLRDHYSIANEKINQLEQLGEDQFFEHPYFGHLKRNNAIRFLEIHTKHHLAIINDIAKGKK